MPNVSICMPSYNQARFLPQTLESVLAQTYEDYEVIMVDDGSTDGSLDIHQKYAHAYSNFHSYTHPGRENKGISASTNLAIQQAQGRYVVILDSDDLWFSDTLERRTAFMEANPSIALMATHYDMIDEENRVIREKAAPDIHADCSSPLVLTHRLIMGCDIGNPTVMLRRDSLADMEWFDETLLHGDWELWVRMVSRYSVGFLPESTALHRRHAGNVTGSHTMEVELQRRLAVMKALQRKSPGDPGVLSIPRLRALIELEMCSYLFCLYRREEAAHCLQTALDIDGTLLNDGGAYFRVWLSQRPPVAQPRKDFHAWMGRLLENVGVKWTEGADI